MKKENKKFISLSVKLTLTLTALAIVSIAFLSTILVRTANTAIEQQVFNHLSAVAQLKSNQVFSFFDRKFADLEIIAEDLNTEQAVNSLAEYLNSTDNTFNVNTKAYNQLYQQIDPFYRSLKVNLDVHDLLLIDAKYGNVMYSVNKNADLGTKLASGEYSNSNLADLWKNIVNQRKERYMVDFSFYVPSKENVIFLGVPVYNHSQEIVAVFALQMGSQELDVIMNESTGMGESGETYLVGEDFFMRSDSRFKNETTVLEQQVNTSSVEMAFNNQSGQHIINDYRGIPVLSYYDKLSLKEKFGTDHDWAIISEIDKEEAFEAEQTLINRIILNGLIIVLVVIASAVLIARSFTKPLLELARVTKLLAEGDLRQEISIRSNDEIGSLATSYRTMQAKLRKQMDELKEGINVLASSSSEIMAMMSQLASGSAETATSVSETTTTIEEVKQTAEVSVQKAREVSDTAQKIASISKQGQHSVEETIEGMNRIKVQMKSIADIVIQLSEKSNTIGEIANNVSDLAEQSNLLAVNASIEAAKAGEHGKGFSVVAQEIKNLASRSKDSTVQIRSILTDIQKEISNAVMATEQGGKVIEAGLEQSSSSKEVISTLAAGVEQTADANIHIAASSQQQLSGMDQITMAMENIKQASHQATEGTMQAEESITELKQLGDKLYHILEEFKLD